MKRIYFDNAATTSTDPRVREAMDPFFTHKYGNPSSVHSFGQETGEAVEAARKHIAAMVNASPNTIIFTSGGSESDNAAIKGCGFALKAKGDHIITTTVEHHAILHSCEFMETQGFRITYVPVSEEGLVDPSDIEKAITARTILISVMHANNETGTIQPIAEIGKLAHERHILFHTDAVQTFGHVPIDVEGMSIDLLSLSAHKLYGPKGVGAFYMRESIPFVSLIHGGGQESGRRSSTLNVPGIVGLGRAAEIASAEMDEENERISSLRIRLHEGIAERISNIHLNGHPTLRLANNLNLSFDHVEGESLLMNLDLEGIAASSGSACSSGSTDPSHVLRAMGLSTERARGSLRLSLGRFSTEAEVDRVTEILDRVVSHLRSLSAF